VGSAATEGLALAGTFTTAALSYWTGVFPRVGALLRRIRRRAQEIPDPVLRGLALEALAKRSNIEGAAAFAVLAPRHTRAAATEALVAFQALYNHADMLAEQPSADPVASARRLHGVLLQALDASAEDRDLGGYVGPLVADCRLALRQLPSYPAVAAQARAAAERIVAFQSLSVAHAGPERDALIAWARSQAPPDSDLRWWEAAAACGSSLPVLALIALAAQPVLAPSELADVQRAYWPWVAALHSLLDSLVDTREDAASGQLSLIGCYATVPIAAEAMGILAERARRDARGLPRGRRHLVLVTAMAASYLSRLRRSSEPQRVIASRVREGIGALARPALLVFALRRA
jgi:tetraprenyl-beta-curcumene synthase